ncbi:MAG: hypothetical protein HYR68_06240 [Burkholderiales bacterium]|nr:hypothetical protein [Burkholderiales bacterium]
MPAYIPVQEQDCVLENEEDIMTDLNVSTMAGKRRHFLRTASGTTLSTPALSIGV